MFGLPIAIAFFLEEDPKSFIRQAFSGFFLEMVSQTGDRPEIEGVPQFRRILFYAFFQCSAVSFIIGFARSASFGSIRQAC